MAASNFTLRITNKAREGYRRAGVVFDRGINQMAASSFTEDQLATLEADPHLVVEVLDEAAPAETGTTEGPVDDGGVDSPVTAAKPRTRKKAR